MRSTKQFVIAISLAIGIYILLKIIWLFIFGVKDNSYREIGIIGAVLIGVSTLLEDKQ